MIKHFMITINSFTWIFLSILATISMVIINTATASASGVGIQLVTGGGRSCV